MALGSLALPTPQFGTASQQSPIVLSSQFAGLYHSSSRKKWRGWDVSAQLEVMWTRHGTVTQHCDPFPVGSAKPVGQGGEPRWWGGAGLATESSSGERADLPAHFSFVTTGNGGFRKGRELERRPAILSHFPAIRILAGRFITFLTHSRARLPRSWLDLIFFFPI